MDAHLPFTDTADDLARLAALVDRYGPDALPLPVQRGLIGRGKAAGVIAEVADVLGDVDAPRVVRERAFGQIHRHLAAVAPSGPPVAVASRTPLAVA